LVTRHLKIDLRPFLNFLGDEGYYRPLHTPQTEGGTSPFWHIPLLATPCCIIVMWGRAEKVVTFFNNISKHAYIRAKVKVVIKNINLKTHFKSIYHLVYSTSIPHILDIIHFLLV
jgi:hypothetical protein